MKAWIEGKNLFCQVYDRALGCVVMDSGRIPTALQKLVFNDVDFLSDVFFRLIQKLLEWSEDNGCEFVMLRPDPEYYFHRFFGKYPIIEITQGMNSTKYFTALNEGPPESPADALGVNYLEYVIAPSSLRWFVHAWRSSEDNGGHLWIPKEWLDNITEEYPYATVAF